MSGDHGLNSQTGRDNKFKRRTSYHNLRLDVGRTVTGITSGETNTCPCNLNLTRGPKFNCQADQIDTFMNSEIVEECKHLFQTFVREEIRREGLIEPAKCFSPLCSTPIGYQNPVWAKTGRELRELADAFNKTMERKKVRQRAQQVGLRDISYEQFYDLLTELFLGDGMTRERILVLFFFCSDLAIRTLRQQTVNIFQKCLEWSQRYIIDRVCLWVQQQGGWATVLQSSMKCLKQVALLVGIAAVGIFLMRWLRTSQ